MSGRPSCGWCHEPVLRAVTVPGNRPIALDPEPTDLGVYEVDLDAMPVVTARRVRNSEVAPAVRAFLGDLLYSPHVETCRNRPESTTAPSATTTAPSAGGSGR